MLKTFLASLLAK